MAAVVIEYSDVRRRLRGIKEDQALELIEGTMARVRLLAPCIDDPTFTETAAAKDIIVDAIVRRANRSPGLVRESKTVGGVTHSTEIDRLTSGLFTPGEVAELRSLCGSDTVTQRNALAQYGFPEPSFDE